MEIPPPTGTHVLPMGKDTPVDKRLPRPVQFSLWELWIGLSIAAVICGLLRALGVGVPRGPMLVATVGQLLNALLALLCARRLRRGHARAMLVATSFVCLCFFIVFLWLGSRPL